MNKIDRPQQGGRHVYPVRVYYEDTDAGNVVYYANYLRFVERARTELLRDIGVAHEYIKATWGVGFVVKSCAVEYVKPAHLDDQLEVVTTTKSVKGASFSVYQDVFRDGELLVSTDIRIACIDTDGEPARLPAEVKAAMTKFMESREEV